MKSLLHANTLLVNRVSYKSNQVQSYAHCGQTQESGSVTSFMHLKWNHFLQVITLNHVSVITFRESTYAVNMNECMLPPTFLSSLLFAA